MSRSTGPEQGPFKVSCVWNSIMNITIITNLLNAVQSHSKNSTTSAPSSQKCVISGLCKLCKLCILGSATPCGNLFPWIHSLILCVFLDSRTSYGNEIHELIMHGMKNISFSSFCTCYMIISFNDPWYLREKVNNHFSIQPQHDFIHFYFIHL